MTFKKKVRATFLLLTLILVGGTFYANRKVKGYGYTGVLDVIETYKKNVDLASKIEANQLKINISNSDFNFIKSKRDIAIDRGIQINVGDNYVPCEIDFEGDKSTGEIRLKGHMTDHLQDDKWSYRVKTDKPVLGMYRFSIQHPGTRNYIYEWIYHELLKNEDVIHLNYDFVEVTLNDGKLGIYALEEHFGQHVLERSNRPAGAILRWNPELYWNRRIDELQGSYIDEQYSDFSSSFVEPYDRGTVKKDSILSANYQKGAYLLEMFRRGKVTTSEVFDIERMARFHVIIDLVGGYHSLDWSDVKFYYNSKSNRIEPVGYESFSLRKTERIAGQRVPKLYGGLNFNYHDQLFADPLFFEAYMKNMKRIVSESYLDAFFEKISLELDQKMGIIGKEWPYRKVSFDGYFDNVKLIRNNIDLPKPFHAFAVPSNKGQLTVSIAPVSDYPIQIIGIKRKNKIKYLDSVVNIPAKARGTYTKYFDVQFENPFKKDSKLLIIAKIPGSDKTFEIEIGDLPGYKSIEFFDSIVQPSNEIDTSMILVNGSSWLFKDQRTILKKKVTIPDTVTLTMYPNQSLHIVNGGKLIVLGSLKMQAYSLEEPVSVQIDCFDGIELRNANFFAKYVQFSGKNILKARSSKAVFSNCTFFDLKSVLNRSANTDITFYKCSSGMAETLGVFDECSISIDESCFKNGNVLGYSNGSFWQIRNSEIRNFDKVLNLSYGSIAEIRRSQINYVDTLVNLDFGSSSGVFMSNLLNIHIGFFWKKNNVFQSEKDVVVYKTDVSGVKSLILNG